MPAHRRYAEGHDPLYGVRAEKVKTLVTKLDGEDASDSPG